MTLGSEKGTVRVVFCVMLFLLGLFLGYIAHAQKKVTPPVSVGETSTNYKFVRPLLFLQVPEDTSTPLLSLKNKVSNYINNTIDTQTATDVSVYFRELNTNQWIGINADDKYAAASMLKVVSLIAFFRATLNNPALLEKEVDLEKGSVNEDTNQDYFPPKNQAIIGNTYLTKELLSYMIVDSDNNAAAAIDFMSGNKVINDTYTDFKIPTNGNVEDQDLFTVKMISKLFRTLYNGAYISEAYSEQALELLSQTNFNNGLVAGVAKGIPVSHKFGERTINIINSILPEKDATIRELHDCGIIYAPSDPYFLCVMTKGSDFLSLQKTISDISSIIWNQTQKSS